MTSKNTEPVQDRMTSHTRASSLLAQPFGALIAFREPVAAVA
jgi:hypothetical protein